MQPIPKNPKQINKKLQFDKQSVKTKLRHKLIKYFLGPWLHKRTIQISQLEMNIIFFHKEHYPFPYWQRSFSVKCVFCVFTSEIKISHWNRPKPHVILIMILNCYKPQFSFQIPNYSVACFSLFSWPKFGCNFWLQSWRRVQVLVCAQDSICLQFYTDYTMILKIRLCLGISVHRALGWAGVGWGGAGARSCRGMATGFWGSSRNFTHVLFY